MTEIAWHISTWSASGGEGCVEAGAFADRVAVRDSRDRSGPMLVYPRESWRAFLAGIKNDELVPRRL